MTLADAAPVTIPTRLKVDDPLQVGDIVTVDDVRWKIRAMSRTGTARLQSMNTSNADIWWTTTVGTLPKRENR